MVAELTEYVGDTTWLSGSDKQGIPSYGETGLCGLRNVEDRNGGMVVKVLCGYVSGVFIVARQSPGYIRCSISASRSHWSGTELRIGGGLDDS